jgi:hypothetical protein
MLGIPDPSGSRIVYPKLLTLWSATLAVLVLLGGVVPALYSYGQPHDHFVLGGPPPVGWDEHEHVNPLTVLLGPIAPMSATPNDLGQLNAPDPLTRPRSTFGQVVSVSAGLSPLVLTDVGLAVGPVFVNWIARAVVFGPVASDDTALAAQTSRGPAPPPPR